MSAAEDKSWQPCPQGELSRLGRRLARHRQRRVLLKKAGYVGAAAVVVATGAFIFVPRSANPDKPPLASVSCKSVWENRQAFAAGTLDPNLREQIVYHLEHCGKCERKYRDLGLIS